MIRKSKYDQLAFHVSELRLKFSTYIQKYNIEDRGMQKIYRDIRNLLGKEDPLLKTFGEERND